MSLEAEIVSRVIEDKSLGFLVNEPKNEPDFANIFFLLDSVKFTLEKKGQTVQDYTVRLPEFFLQNPVTDNQRGILDEKLGPYYAQESVLLQKEVAKVPINECGEKLAFLPKLFSEAGIMASFSEIPFNQACGEWAGKQRVFWVRKSMAERLLVAGSVLHEVGLYMHFEDAFRPVGVQEGLFQRRVNWIVEQHPDWDREKVLQEAMSKTAVTPRLASHKSGAAVDITLKLPSGEPLDIGNRYPEGGALVSLNCPFLTKDQWYSRQIFAGIFTMSGFTTYPGEDWHVSFGDNLAGVVNGKVVHGYTSMYGPIKSFDQEMGDIKENYNSNELDNPFNGNS